MRGWVLLRISGSDFRRAKAREPAGIAKLLGYLVGRRVNRCNRPRQYANILCPMPPLHTNRGGSKMALRAL